MTDTKNTLPAKTTEYNGIKFRSRLEARWAVFFDAAGVEYIYEAEDLIGRDSTRYLPDFYLPEYDWYVEVKPAREGFAFELARAVRVAVEDNRKVLITLGDIPKDRERMLLWFPMHYYHPKHRMVTSDWILFRNSVDDDDNRTFHIADWHPPESSSPVNVLWIADPCRCELSKERVKHVIEGCKAELSGIPDDEMPYPVKSSYLTHDCDEYGNEYSTYYLGDTHRCSGCSDDKDYAYLRELYKRARQARFEHGETPKAEKL